MAAGSLTTLSPCVFPLLPLVLGGTAQRHSAAPVAMGLGMITSFAALGILLGTVGDAIGLNPENVRTAAAVVLVAFGLTMVVPQLNTLFTRWVSPLASSAQHASSALNPGSLTGAFWLGGLLGLIWSPCSGPMLGSALTLVATEGGAARGALILGLFGLGAALPLVAAAYLSRVGFGRIRQWVLVHGEQGKKLFGSILLVFLISHLATFKYGTYYETTVGGVAMRDLHRLVTEIFKQPGYVAWYVVALIFLGFHLSHGVGSAFQSFGALNDRWSQKIKHLSWAYAGLVAAGFLAQPIYVYFIAG